MKGCARWIAGVALLLFALSAVLSVLFITIRLYLLSPQTYTLALEQEDVYAELPAIVADQLIYGMNFNPCLEDPSQCEGDEPPEASVDGEGGPPSYFTNLSEEIWERVISALIDPIWIEAQIEDVLEQVFSLLTGETPRESIVISFQEIRDRVQEGAGFEAVLEVMRAQPDCTPAQILEISQAISSDGLDDAIIRCNPPEDVLRVAEPYIQEGLAEIVRELPSNLEVDIPPEFYQSGGSAALAFSIVRAALKFAPWVALFWLMTVTVLAVRDVRSWSAWWGTGLFLAGLGSLLLGLAFGPLLDWGLDRMLQNHSISGFSPVMVDTALRVANNILDGFSQRVLIVAGVLLGFGLVLLILRLFTREHSQGQIGTRLPEPRSDS